MFGHVLWMTEKVAAQESWDFAEVGSSTYKVRRGHDCKNLLDMLQVEPWNTGLEALRSDKRLRELGTLTKERSKCHQIKNDWIVL